MNDKYNGKDLKETLSQIDRLTHKAKMELYEVKKKMKLY